VIVVCYLPPFAANLAIYTTYIIGKSGDMMAFGVCAG